MDGLDQVPKPKAGRLLQVLKIVAIVAVILCLLAAGLSYAGWRYVQNGLKPTAASSQTVRLTIPSDSNSTQIAQLLEENGLIRNSTLFIYYLKYKKQGDHFKAGTYDMNPGIDKTEIIRRLNEGDIVKEEVLRFTIPEGYTVRQIADRLSSQHIVASAAEFIKAADTKRGYPCRIIASVPSGAGIKHVLEGYLFPETYEMKKDSTPDDIIDRMVCEWDNKLTALPDDWQTQLQKLSITFDQMVTLASLIEREVVVDKERPLVAGVIYNRLKQKMPLQIDATIQYLFDQPKERLFDKDLQIESPYNTYLHTGLPPGPIASPSLASIRAALYPQETDYLYYVTKNDGSHEHLFAKTFAEHERNIAKSKEVN